MEDKEVVQETLSYESKGEKEWVEEMKRVTERPGPGSIPGHVGFVVDKVALGQVFSEYFGFPCQSSFHQLLHNHYHPGLVQ
jgi:hypothetical protein